MRSTTFYQIVVAIANVGFLAYSAPAFLKGWLGPLGFFHSTFRYSPLDFFLIPLMLLIGLIFHATYFKIKETVLLKNAFMIFINTFGLVVIYDLVRRFLGLESYTSLPFLLLFVGIAALSLKIYRNLPKDSGMPKAKSTVLNLLLKIGRILFFLSLIITIIMMLGNVYSDMTPDQFAPYLE